MTTAHSIWQGIYTQFSPKLLPRVLSRIGRKNIEIAEDSIQVAWFKLLGEIEAGIWDVERESREPGSTLKWLSRTAINKANDEFKRLNRWDSIITSYMTEQLILSGTNVPATASLAGFEVTSEPLTDLEGLSDELNTMLRLCPEFIMNPTRKTILGAFVVACAQLQAEGVKLKRKQYTPIYHRIGQLLNHTPGYVRREFWVFKTLYTKWLASQRS